VQIEHGLALKKVRPQFATKRTVEGNAQQNLWQLRRQIAVETNSAQKVVKLTNKGQRNSSKISDLRLA